MSPVFDLHRAARGFAESISLLLNRTVCDGISLNAVLTKPDRVLVGHRLAKRDHVSAAVPLARPRQNEAYLAVFYRLRANAIRRHLEVETSVTGLYADAELHDELFRYDYERDKTRYPEAHLQINVEPDTWKRLGPPDRPFKKVHLPLGGRRNRPILEDLVEFCIVEGIAPPRAGWEDAVAEGRERFRVGQLKAAVRRDPDSAREVLAEIPG